MARFEHENKVRRKELKPEKKWNPPLFGIRNPVPGIRNPQHGIQNPRLSWIPLHGATFSFRSIQKHRRAPERNERELARNASSSPTPTPCTGGQKIPPGFCFLSRALD